MSRRIAVRNFEKQIAAITSIGSSKTAEPLLSMVVLVATAKSSNRRLHKRHIDRLIDEYYKSMGINSENKPAIFFSPKVLTKRAPKDIFQLSNASRSLILTDWSKLGLEASEPETLKTARKMVTKRLLNQVFSRSLDDISDLNQSSVLRLIKITLENKPITARGLIKEVFSRNTFLEEELKPYVADFIAVFNGDLIEAKLKQVKLEKLPIMGFDVEEAPNYMILWCRTSLERIRDDPPSEANSVNCANLYVLLALAFQVKGLVFRAIECRKKAAEYYRQLNETTTLEYREDIEQNTRTLGYLCKIAELTEESAEKDGPVKPECTLEPGKIMEIVFQYMNEIDLKFEKNLESISQFIAKYSFSLADEFTQATLKYQSDVTKNRDELYQLMSELNPEILDDNPQLEKMHAIHLKPEKTYYESTERIIRQLSKQEPRFKLLLAYVCRDLGDIYAEREQFVDCASTYKAAFDLFFDLADADVTFRNEVIKTLARLKKDKVTSQAQAVECYIKAVPFIEELAETNESYKIMCLWYQMRIADYYSEKSALGIVYRKKTLRFLRELASTEDTPDQVMAIHRPHYSFKKNLVLTLVELGDKCVTPEERIRFYTEALGEYRNTFCPNPKILNTKVKKWSLDELDQASRIIASLGTEYALLGGEKNLGTASQFFVELDMLIEQRSQLLLLEKSRMDETQFELIGKKIDLYYLIHPNVSF